MMPKKRFRVEQIVVVLRQIEVLQSQGKSPPVETDWFTHVCIP